MRDVCSARASWRPIQYSSWAIRASIYRAWKSDDRGGAEGLLPPCCCCCCWEDQAPPSGSPGIRGGCQRFSGDGSGRCEASSSSTHVSFEPPPWEELTIIE